MGELPGNLRPDRYRDLGGRGPAPWARRVYLVILLGLVVFTEWQVNPTTNGRRSVSRARRWVVSPDEVRWAVFENGGSVSFIPRSG